MLLLIIILPVQDYVFCTLSDGGNIMTCCSDQFNSRTKLSDIKIQVSMDNDPPFVHVSLYLNLYTLILKYSLNKNSLSSFLYTSCVKSFMSCEAPGADVARCLQFYVLSFGHKVVRPLSNSPARSLASAPARR